MGKMKGEKNQAEAWTPNGLEFKLQFDSIYMSSLTEFVADHRLKGNR